MDLSIHHYAPVTPGAPSHAPRPGVAVAELLEAVEDVGFDAELMQELQVLRPSAAPVLPGWGLHGSPIVDLSTRLPWDSNGAMVFMNF